MTLREANINDINFIFKLYNYWISKNVFFKKKPRFLEHKNWFLLKYLREKLIVIYIASFKKKKLVISVLIE